MTLIEQTAHDAVADYRLADKKARGDWIGAIKAVRKICGVDLRTAQRALLDACAQIKERS